MVQIHQIPFFIVPCHGDGDAIGVFCVVDTAISAACAFMAEGQKTAIIFCIAVFYLVGLLFTLCTIFDPIKNAYNRLGVAI